MSFTRTDHGPYLRILTDKETGRVDRYHYDMWSDAHGTLSNAMRIGGVEFWERYPEFHADLVKVGLNSEPFSYSYDDEEYARQHAAGANPSQSILGYLTARAEQVGVFAPPAPAPGGGDESPATYPGQPMPHEMVELLEEFAVTTATSGDEEKSRYVRLAYKESLTAENIDAWIFAHRFDTVIGEDGTERKVGLVRQPRHLDADPAAKSVFRAWEDALADWGIAITAGADADTVEAKRKAFVRIGHQLRAMVSVSAGSIPSSGFGDYIIDARRAKYRLLRVLDNGVAGQVGYSAPTNVVTPYPGQPGPSATEAAAKMAGLSFVLGVPTRYDGLLSSQFLSENDWRYYRAQRWDGSRYVTDPRLWQPTGTDSGGLGMGGGR